MNVAASIVDTEAADRAANRIVLAYEIGDALSTFTDESAEQNAAALSVAMATIAFCALQVGLTERGAVPQFTSAFRSVRKHMKRLGKGVRLSEVLTEMSLDQRRERRK